jgi:GT2 family glycosyltransferase/2-polyprenyl-3-methyl-5-hydroxy-6-metoxy-1,4-benzoquinol methylase
MILHKQGEVTVYSDGETAENEMLRIAESYPEAAAEEFISGDSRYTINNTFSPVRRNLLNWYPFKENADILEVGAGMGALTGLLCDVGATVTAVEMNRRRAEVIAKRYPKRKNLTILSLDINSWITEERFDYIVVVGVLEYAAVFGAGSGADPHVLFLRSLRGLLKPDGIVLLAIENRFGLKYWLGASEDHIGEPFVGINGFKEEKKPRTFTKAELGELFRTAGFGASRCYYVLPDYKFPSAIFTDEFPPQMHELLNISFIYGRGTSLVANERDVYPALLKEGDFGMFSNSLLIEAGVDAIPENHIIRVGGKKECKPEYRIITTIDSKGRVEKRAADPRAEGHIRGIYENGATLQERGVGHVRQEYTNGVLVMDRIDAPTVNNIFCDALNRGDFNGAKRLIDAMRETIEQSSPASEEASPLVRRCKELEGLDLGPFLRDGYADLTPYNAFAVNGQFLFFDQEWSFPGLPARFILYYGLKTAYERNPGNTAIAFDEIRRYIEVGDKEAAGYDALEDLIWQSVFLRSGDVYGADGYCNTYNDELTLRRQQWRRQQESENVQRELADAHARLVDARQDLADAHVQLTDIQGELADTQGELADTQGKLADARAQLEDMKCAHENQTQTLRNKEGHIELLLESERELERLRPVAAADHADHEEFLRIRSSRAWRLTTALWRISAAVVPAGSMRRLLAKILWRLFRHPIRFIKKLSFRKAKAFLRALKAEGVSSVSRRIDNNLIEPSVPQIVPEVVDISPSVATKTLSDYAPLVFEHVQDPTVSIVIPVYNQFEYTYECLAAVLRNSSEIRYEVVVADDCSTDLTVDMDRIVTNVRIIRNSENLRFLKNCNNAARYAYGKYILFLNNDTQVQPQWLISLVSLMERDERIGLAGSKLVYADGRLQEAGGILWNDGSAWNYGNGADPALSEYNYVKEVDYISGAAIMIRRDLWWDIGGFDEQFAPAYCEDSDLAFEVRKRGYKVVYQPASVVVHFEGVSNGTDLLSGQKAYQSANERKFFEKWREVLQKEHYKNGARVFSARDKSGKKKTLLMIDHYVPHYDRDAGSRTIFQYLGLFTEAGFNVKFIGDNFHKHEPYTTVLEQMGIEVLYGSYYSAHWKEWLKVNGEYLDFVFLNRPHISVKYIDAVRKFTNAKIIYYGHDLHCLREKREYELTGDAALLASLKDWEKKEFGLMKAADIVYYPSQVEVDEIKKTDISINVKAVPAYIFPWEATAQPDFSTRRDILFVGGFGHRPNVDAVEWLAEKIAPILSEQMPDLKIHVVGSNVPDSILALHSEMLDIVGCVTDEQLDEYYRTCRLAIVPLRFGAGVKGKVVEAMCHGMPVITTTTGAEGIPGAQECLFIEDDAEMFANRTVEVYNDCQLLNETAIREKENINQNFTKDAVISAIGGDFALEEDDAGDA